MRRSAIGALLKRKQKSIALRIASTKRGNVKPNLNVQIVQPNKAVIYGTVEHISPQQLIVRVGRITYCYDRSRASQNKAGDWIITNALPVIGHTKTASLL